LSVSRLIRAFSARTTVPVSTEEVLQVLKAWGVRDDIWFHEDDMDTDIIKGQVVEWEGEAEDGRIELYAHISTARGLSNAEKRLVQCKELLHLLDDDAARVHDPDAVWNLIREVVATPDENNLYGAGAGQGDDDRQTILNALAILFPWHVRELFLPGYQLGVIDAEYIAARVELPVDQVRLVMSNKWPEIYGKMAQARFVPVFDENGTIQLYDIYVGNKWIGSKRTIEQCEDRVQHLLAG
jgi:hypothetical protein